MSSYYRSKVSALIQHSVRLIPTQCPPYSNTFYYLNKCLPYYSRIVSALFHQLSALFQQILTLKIVSALIQQSVKKCPPLLQQSAKKCPPYSNILLVRLITVRLSTVPLSTQSRRPALLTDEIVTISNAISDFPLLKESKIITSISKNVVVLFLP